jgi:hypothetical protein
MTMKVSNTGRFVTRLKTRPGAMPTSDAGSIGGRQLARKEPVQTRAYNKKPHRGLTRL